MKTVLLITNGFPPLIGGGILRPSRLAKYLPEWGWHPIVLTMSVPAEASRLGEPGEKYARDILRMPRLDLTEFYMICRRRLGLHGKAGQLATSHGTAGRDSEPVALKPRLSTYLLVPDQRILWVPGAILAALWILVRRRPKAIFSMSPDPSAHLVAWALARLSGIHWVAEFRDPWVTNPFRHPRPFGWMERLEHWMERKVVLDCNHLCVTSVEYKEDFLRRYSGLAEEKISHIPNGFDPADFDGVVSEKFKRFTILHAGNFYGARSATLFLGGYARLLARRPDLQERTQVVFVGNLDTASVCMLGDKVMKANIVLKGQRTHRETLRLTCGADLLLLVPGPGNGTMPGKVYEYLRAGRPVYCLASEGPVTELLSETGGGVTERSSDPDEISVSLEGMIDNILGGNFSRVCPPEKLKRYDRREIAGRIAAVLEPHVHA